jgi:hypothetical protein
VMECYIRGPGLHNHLTSTQLRWFGMSWTTVVFCDFISIPISCCKSSSYSSWGAHNLKHDIIQNINRQEQNYIHFLLKAQVAYISTHTPPTI